MHLYAYAQNVVENNLGSFGALSTIKYITYFEEYKHKYRVDVYRENLNN